MVWEFATIRQASSAAAAYMIDLVRSAVAARGICTIALAGGSTPQLTYQILSEPANAAKIDWQRCHFFWGDERWVAATHPDSNFYTAHRLLLSKVPVPAPNIHRIATGLPAPAIGAERYEKDLRLFFAARQPAAAAGVEAGPAFPVFDLVFLGMGTDGHTASLFPGSVLLEERRKWVGAVPAGTGSPPVPRITLTLPVLNQAENILFLIAGSRKRQILNTIMARPAEAERLYPAARVKPAGTLIWLAAAES